MKPLSNTLLLLGSVAILPAWAQDEPQKQPNIILIITDDQGYQDLGCYGAPLIQTPSIDALAQEGMRMTDFYVSASVSSASRASILTGRLNSNNGVKGVLWPGDNGLPLSETTLAEALKELGYATACCGKWHLGDTPEHLPSQRGFDYYLGIPYSNDMYIGPTQEFHTDVCFREGYTLEQARKDQKLVQEHIQDKEFLKKSLKYAVPLLENDRIVEYPCDQALTTRRYFDAAIRFIDSIQGACPFFVYITPNMPHIPLAVSEDFQGISRGGKYGDAVEEIDWNVGRLTTYLEQKGLDKNTIVIYASDNGPWLSMQNDGGSAGPLRDGKFSNYEGGVRVPCIIRWKGVVPAGTVSHAIMASIDLFPTLVRCAGGEPSDLIDGVDCSAMWRDPNTSVNDAYLHIRDGQLFGIRFGDWKFLPQGGGLGKPTGPELYFLKDDLSEQENLYPNAPDKAQELENEMQNRFRKTCRP